MQSALRGGCAPDAGDAVASTSPDLRALVEATYRAESRRVFATLVRLSAQFGLPTAGAVVIWCRTRQDGFATRVPRDPGAGGWEDLEGPVFFPI